MKYLFILCPALWLCAACSEPISEKAHPPVIQSFALSRSQVYVKEYIEVQTVVKDLDKGDKLTYEWSADGGLFANPHNPYTQWHAPAQAGHFTIRLQVSDGFFIADTSAAVQVIAGS